MWNSAPGPSAGASQNFQFKTFLKQTHLTQWKCSSWWYSEGFLEKHKSFRTSKAEKWNMPTNQRKNSVKPIYLDRTANSLPFELPKNCLTYLTCQLPKPRNICSLAFRQNSSNFIYNWSAFFHPEIVFISSIQNGVGVTASAWDCKGFNIYYLQRTAARTEQILPTHPGTPE